MRQISIPGRYNAKVELAEIRQSEATGAYYLYMEFANDDGECASKRLYLSEKALEYSVKSLNEAFDFDGDFSSVGTQLVGAECRITVAESETENDGKYLEVRFINRISPRDSPASADAIGRLSAMAKGALAAKNGKKEDTVGEISDLLYHLTVMMVNENIPLDDVRAELNRRHGKTGNLKTFHKVDHNT